MLSFETAPRSIYGDSLPPPELIAETQDVRTVEVARGVRVGYTILNGHLLGEASPVISIGGFMSSLTDAARAWEGVQLASLDRPVLMVDMPAHGYSTPHTPRQIFDLSVRRRIDAQVAPIIEAIHRLVNPNDEIDYFGISHGAYLALKATQNDPGDRVKTVFGIDIPAVKRQPSLVLNASLLLDKHRKKAYLRALEGSNFITDFEAFETEFKKNPPVQGYNIVQNNFGLFCLGSLASANANAGALKTWKSVMDTKSANVRVVTSDKGFVSHPDAIARFIKALPEGQRVRSSQKVAYGENHNIGIVYLMPRAVAWAREAYDLYQPAA